MGGDFNAISDPAERKGNASVSKNVDIGKFNEFIIDMDLVDLSSSRNRFTWYSGDDNYVSKIDRFLVVDVIIDSWFADKGFLKFVELEWKQIYVEGRSDFIVKEKLKMLKGSLKKWNKENYGWIDLKVDELMDLINELDLNLFSVDGNGEEDMVQKRALACKTMWRKLYLKDNLLLQKAKVN
ncbi:unnamed protein product [Lathyrus sativus]|nr:unnamed protein product [Lathyrus sativus]